MSDSYISLSVAEQQVIDTLTQKGIPKSQAIIAVVMATRSYVRPESELVDILRHYPSLEDSAKSREYLGALRLRGWIVESESYGKVLVAPAEKLASLIANYTGTPSYEQMMTDEKIRNIDSIEVLGPVTETYHSFLGLLESAQKEICLPMLSTSPSSQAVGILSERAKAGVKVRILIAHPSLTVKLRGPSQQRLAQEAMAGWIRHAKEHSFAVRVIHAAEDAILSTCLLIDRRVVRFDVYDVHKTRSLQGIILQVRSPDGFSYNFVEATQTLFDQIWNRAQSPAFGARFGAFVTGNWRWLMAAVFLGLTFGARTNQSSMEGVWGSIAGTLLLDGFILSAKQISAALKRLWEKVYG